MEKTADLPPTDRSFAELYQAEFAFTFGCLRRFGVTPADLDDALQDLWLIAHRRFGQLRPQASVRAWLYAIARRVASHRRRAAARHHRKLDELARVPSSSAGPDPDVRQVIEAVLQRLDPATREAFVLSEVEGWTAPEISAATRANLNTIYWRVRTARLALRNQLCAEGIYDVDGSIAGLREPPGRCAARAQHVWLGLAPKLGAKPGIWATIVGLGAAKPVAAVASLAAVVLVGVGIGGAAVRSQPVVTAVVGSSTSSEAWRGSESEAPKPGAAVLGRGEDRVESPGIGGGVDPRAQSRGIGVAAIAVHPRREPQAPEVDAVAMVGEAAGGSAPLGARQLGDDDGPPRADESDSGFEVAGSALETGGKDGIDPAEMAGLLAAQRAFARGDLDVALDLVTEHRRRFRGSSLGDLRGVLEVKIRCGQGDGAGARAVAKALSSAALDPVVAEALAKGCSSSG